MSYYTTPEVIARLRIGQSVDDGNEPRLGGCTDFTKGYGQTPGVETFEVGVARGDILDIPEIEWPERLELQEQNRATLFDRIDADWKRPLTQGRCGYCWSYAVICAMQAAMARDGRKHVPLSAASVAAQVKNGADRGGWPTEAAEFISKRGVCTLDEWPDCSCRGGGCGGPRSGCKARDLSQVSATTESALQTEFKFYELPRGQQESQRAVITGLLQGLPVAGGWSGTGAWADGHAMGILHVMRTGRWGWQCVPENSWGQFKRRIPTEAFPRGGVIVVRSHRKGQK
jgi:hypothetical protein